METDALRWFQQVADGVTVTEVADVYLVSQPGVSRALARLDAEVGTPLLQRTGRVLRPTHAGRVFKRHVDAILHGLDDGLAAVNELVDPETGSVAVAFQPSLGTWLVPHLIGGFRRAHPGVQFRLEQAHDDVGSSPVYGGQFDLAFTARRPRNPAVRWHRLLTEPLLLAVPPDHRLAGSTETSLQVVAEEEFVMLEPTWELRRLTDDLCSAAGFVPRVAFEAGDLQVVRGLVASGLGVAVVPAMGVEVDGHAAGQQGERLLRLADDLASREVGVSWSQERRLLPAAAMFRRYVLGS